MLLGKLPIALEYPFVRHERVELERAVLETACSTTELVAPLEFINIACNRKRKVRRLEK